jgi:hypothetical protein
MCTCITISYLIAEEEPQNPTGATHQDPRTMPVTNAILTQILAQLETIQLSQQAMQAKVRYRIRTSSFNGSHPELQLDALSTAEQTSPLEPQAIIPSSPPKVSTPVPSSKIAPSLPNSTPGVITDKEREKLLYPGRVNLTSE